MRFDMDIVFVDRGMLADSLLMDKCDLILTDENMDMYTGDISTTES